MKKPKLVMLNGFAGSGKSTLVTRYLEDHKFALGFEGDVFITMLGGWEDDWYGAAELKLLHSKNSVRTHLEAGYDVVLPFLLKEPQHATEYEEIAQETGAEFYEIYLELDRDEAIERLYKRGTWGEKDSPKLTEADSPKIEKLYDDMVSATKERTGTVYIQPNWGEIEKTYQELLKAIGD